MEIKKLLVLFAALVLAMFIDSKPASAQVCDPSPVTNPTGDCDGDGIPNSTDTCDNLDGTADCDGDGIPNSSDTCDNLDPAADCDDDGVANEDDECPDTVVGEALVIGECSLASFGNTIAPNGCSLTESFGETLAACEARAKNHGQYVSCVTRAANVLKKQKVISGKQKGQITSCAAQADIP